MVISCLTKDLTAAICLRSNDAVDLQVRFGVLHNAPARYIDIPGLVLIPDVNMSVGLLHRDQSCVIVGVDVLGSPVRP